MWELCAEVCDDVGFGVFHGDVIRRGGEKECGEKDDGGEFVLVFVWFVYEGSGGTEVAMRASGTF